MKINLRWRYNNVRIKKGNKWKAVFTTSERSFEPTVVVATTHHLRTNDLINNKSLSRDIS